MLHRLTNEELDRLPLVQFEQNIQLVDTIEKLHIAVSAMRQETMLGFDTETRPSFKRGVSYNCALLQLSTETTAWLIRTNCIGVPDELVEILQDTSILKAGVAIRDDIRGLQKLHNFRPGNFVELQDMARQFGLEDFSLKKLAAHVMGVRISKRQRLSNWEADILTAAQQHYAATDAWVSLLIYKGLQQGIVEHPRLHEIIEQITLRQQKEQQNAQNQTETK